MNAPEPDRATPEVELEIHEQLATAIVTLRGDHDLTTQPLVIEALERASDHQQVLVDLSACSFADSTVIKALLVAHANAKQRDGRLEVVIPAGANAVRRVAQLTRLADTVPIHTTRPAFGLQRGGLAR